MTETAKLDALKPCPFCGGTDINTAGPCYTQFMCNGCGVSQYDQPGHAEAITAWNTRALSFSRPTVIELKMTPITDGLPVRDEFRGEQTILTYCDKVGTWDISFMEAGWDDYDAGFALGVSHWLDITSMWPGAIAQVQALSSLSPPTGGWKLVGYLKPAHPAAVEPFFIDAAARTEDWQKSVFSQPVYTPLPSPPEAE
ncbi:Lar family restriction alleviation protein [Devosia sp. 2618]|uniref:Lar family restriction alleviation protein n=1 Tax=Devosia sp. 2618 TaxID=3156454 RepID=UPI003394B9DA